MKVQIAHRTRRASALVISLIFVVMVTIIVLATVIGMKLERSSAGSHLDKVRSEFIAMMALDDAVARLRSATANPDAIWISQPGRLVVSGTAASDQRYKLKEEISLHSGTGVPGSPSLNIPTLSDPTSSLIFNPTTSSNNSMQIAWIPVTDASGKTNGRYAFWIDDESTKVNYNLAWKRGGGNSNALASPTQINLTALEDLDETAADALHAAITTDNYQSARFFNSPYDARRMTNAGLPAILQKNKFYITHYSHSPDTTFFNEPRIVLTTQESKANGQPFIDILKTANSDPGGRPLVTLDPVKLNNTINQLKNYLQRTDWPMTSSAKSLQDKYYGGTSTRLAQIALNIIDYVRSKESSALLIPPLRGVLDTSGTFIIQGSGNTDAFFGVARTPMINEIGAWMNSARNEIKLKIELYLPPNYGIPSIDLSNNRFTLYTHLYDYPKTSSNTGFVKIAASECSSTTLNAGSYITITRTLTLTSPPASRPTQLYLRVLFQANNSELIGDLDMAPLLDARILACPIDAATVGEADIRSLEVSDPRVNKHPGDWKVSTSNTFGAQNSNYKTFDASIKPQQDIAANGSSISDASLFMPAPKGTSNNLSGLVISPGELGFIHTGVEGTAKAGVPWRTLRLQPNNDENTDEVPDWALMDVFTVPVQAPPGATDVFRPHVGSIGGRININSAVEPFDIERFLPVAALLKGAGISTLDPNSLVTAQEASTIASNIIEKTLASSGKVYGWADAYDSPGEIVEIKGVADGGEESEELVRQIINQTTTRSNVFSIYAIGQSLNPNNGTVTGEQRFQFMLERYVDSGEVHFRTIYARPLTP